MVSNEGLQELLEAKKVDDLEELSGAAFLYPGYVRQSTRTEKLLLFPEDLNWLAVRLFDEDEVN